MPHALRPRNAARSTRLVLAIGAAVTAFVAVHGFAASLDASTGGLGAGDKVVASCGTGMTLTYTTSFYARASGFAVTGIDLRNIPVGCLGKSLSLVFFGSGDRPNGAPIDLKLPESGGDASIPVTPSLNTIDANDIGGISAVIS
jgi:hypothetical protein